MLESLTRRVLIVDDDETARMFVQAVMEGLGWQTLEARDGEEGLDLAVSEQPDLIILDVSMPGRDGMDVFHDLRTNHFTEKIPIIFLTAVNSRKDGVCYTPEEIEAAYGVPGPEGFVDKPVDGAFLTKCVMGVVG